MSDQLVVLNEVVAEGGRRFPPDCSGSAAAIHRVPLRDQALFCSPIVFDAVGENDVAALAGDEATEADDESENVSVGRTPSRSVHHNLEGITFEEAMRKSEFISETDTFLGATGLLTF